MRIAIAGAFGQLGTELQRVLPGQIVPLGRERLDLAGTGDIAAVLDEIRPDFVVNAAAYNLVDRAEEEPQTAFAVNALGPMRLARWCGARDVPLLHVSTDYVFGLDAGRCTPYAESEPVSPVSAYGLSKAAGESAVRAYCPRHFLVRTCGLYGLQPTRGKGNFVETMLRLGREREELRIVDDQRCTPTSVADLAPAIAALLETDAYGTYHATNAGDATWRQFAEEIFRQAGLSTRVVPVTSAEYGAKARRPSYSVLDGSKLRALTGLTLPRWQEALTAYLSSRSTS